MSGDAWGDPDNMDESMFAEALDSAFAFEEEAPAQAPDDQQAQDYAEAPEGRVGSQRDGPGALTPQDGMEEDEYEDIGQGADAVAGPSQHADPAGPLSQYHQGDAGGTAGGTGRAGAQAGSLSDKDALRRSVLSAMTEDQLDRYECYRRSSLARPKMKKLLSTVLGNNSFTDKLVIAMCGITKMFVGDLVETARVVAHEEGHTSALLPRHMRRAFAVLHQRGGMPRKVLPRRMLR